MSNAENAPATGTSRSVLSAIRRSLRARLLVGTLLGICVALVLAGFVLTNFFSHYANKQFQASMQIHLNRLAASFEVDADGKPVLTSPLTDPRFSQPLSGLYWQINDARQNGLARSRSLWDDVLVVPKDAMLDDVTHKNVTKKDSSPDPTLHIHSTLGPDNTRLLVLERIIRTEEHPDQAWQLIIASSTSELEDSIQEWTHRLILFLSVLFVLFAFASVAQVLISLAPLRSLQKALAKLRGAPLQRLEGNFPQEVQPLIDDFNKVLDHSVQVVERARTQTGDLAHSLKTPLAVLSNAASRSSATTNQEGELARIVQEQVSMMQRHIDWRLQRARTSATSGMPANQTLVKQSLEQLLRVMARVHAERQLTYDLDCQSDDLTFPGEMQDFQEMLGNLLDNASKWAKSRVGVLASRSGHRLVITIDDDGPGLSDSQYKEVLQRGIRADEKTPGSGLGLAIVKELSDLYEGQLTLSRSPLGGLRVILTF